MRFFRPRPTTQTFQARPRPAGPPAAPHPRPARAVRTPAATPAPQPAPSADDAPAPSAALAEPQTLTFPATISFPPAPDTAAAATPTLSPSQLAFLKRKSAYLAGTGPLFPPESNCPACGGMGSHECRGCKGTCSNPPDFVPPRGLVIEDARQFNGRVDVTYFLLPGSICFYCKGRGVQACTDCEGTGFTGGRMELFSGD
jgi:hypothetical protein